MRYMSKTSVVKKLTIFGICGFLCVVFISINLKDGNISFHFDELESCYFDLPSSNESLFVEEPSNRSIFFIETTCSANKEINLTPRKICAIESAARMNPHMTVYLLILSHSKWSAKTEEMMRLLNSRYQNILFKSIIINDYVMNTPLEQWWASRIFKTSYWPKSHASDVLRFLTLWKFGGIYLDLDVVVKSSLENLTNFVGAESSEDLNAAAFGLGSTGLGRKVADACMEDLKKNFQGHDWGNNGPGVITRVLRNLCATENVPEMTVERCQGFNVYSPSVFFPIHFKKWHLYFTSDTEDRNQAMNYIQKSLTIHVWNKFSESKPVRVGSDVPYATIASEYCPNIYKSCGEVF